MQWQYIKPAQINGGRDTKTVPASNIKGQCAGKTPNTLILAYRLRSNRKYTYLMTFTDSWLCFLSSNFKGQITNSSQYVHVLGVDMYQTSISMWIQWNSTWLPARCQKSKKIQSHLYVFSYRIALWLWDCIHLFGLTREAGRGPQWVDQLKWL